MKLHSALFVLLSLTATHLAAAGYFAPGVIDHKPIKGERTLGNKIKASGECAARNGDWQAGVGYAYCVLPYPDAGKLCKTSKGCIGHCTMPLNKRDLAGKPLPRGHGICQLDDEPDDCGRHQFENGKVIIFNCD